MHWLPPLQVAILRGGGHWWRQPAPETLSPLRFSLDAPPDTEFRNVYSSSAISPKPHAGFCRAEGGAQP